jgi:GNAT superfamily N-acetyltransferase
MKVEIRKGLRRDIPGAFKLVKELAEFEKAPEEVINTIEQLEEDRFGNRPYFDFFVADLNGEIVGLALYFFSYSTWKGKSLFLDDLIVTEKYRRNGIGQKLFNEVAKVAKEENCGKMHWQVLDWNTPAIEYYKTLGTRFDGEWVNCILSKEELSKY